MAGGKLRSDSTHQHKLEFVKELSERCPLKEIDIRGNNLTVANIVEVMFVIRECETIQKVHFMNEQNKWPLNSRSYIDMNNQLTALYMSGSNQRKFTVDKVNDIIKFEQSMVDILL